MDQGADHRQLNRLLIEYQGAVMLAVVPVVAIGGWPLLDVPTAASRTDAVAGVLS